MPLVFSHKRSRSAFTLIELLCVICIIAQLAAILFPAFARVREGARRTSCMSNLKQISLGLMQYSQDFDEALPCGCQSGGNGWGTTVFPYLQSNQIFTCPSDTSQSTDTNRPDTISYAYNLAIPYAANGYPGGGRIAAFRTPVKTVMLSEVENAFWRRATDSPTCGNSYSPAGDGLPGAQLHPVNTGIRYATGYFDTMPVASPTAQYTNRFGRHLQGANYAFADGHVKWLKTNTVSPGLAAPEATSEATGCTTSCSGGSITNVTSGNNAAGTENPKYAATYSPT